MVSYWLLRIILVSFRVAIRRVSADFACDFENFLGFRRGLVARIEDLTHIKLVEFIFLYKAALVSKTQVCQVLPAIVAHFRLAFTLTLLFLFPIAEYLLVAPSITAAAFRWLFRMC